MNRNLQEAKTFVMGITAEDLENKLLKEAVCRINLLNYELALALAALEKADQLALTTHSYCYTTPPITDKTPSTLLWKHMWAYVDERGLKW